MRWLEKIRVGVRMLFNRGRELEHLDAEIRFHLEQLTVENICAGMSPAEARAAAVRAFGSPALLGEEVRETWNWTKLELALRDLQRSIRTLAKSPGFTALAIVVLALGVGANVALFTVARSVLWKPLPFRDPEQLIRFYEVSSDDRFPYNNVAGGIFAEWRKQSHAFSDLAILVGWPRDTTCLPPADSFRKKCGQPSAPGLFFQRSACNRRSAASSPKPTISRRPMPPWS